MIDVATITVHKVTHRSFKISNLNPSVSEYIYIYIHVYVYIYIYIYTCIYGDRNEDFLFGNVRSRSGGMREKEKAINAFYAVASGDPNRTESNRSETARSLDQTRGRQ